MSISAMSSAASVGDLDGELLSSVELDDESPALSAPAAPEIAAEPPPLPVELPPEPQVETEPLRIAESKPAPLPEIEIPAVEPVPLLDEPLSATAAPQPSPPDDHPAVTAAPRPLASPSGPSGNSVGSQPSLGSIGNNGETSPRFGGNAPIPYPPEAVRERAEGRVVLRLHIDESGRVTAVDVVQSSGHAALDRAAAEGVRTWRAEPARLLGRPIATTALLPVQFRMK